MRSKVVFSHPKFRKMKVAYWSKMARTAIESDFRSSKMAAGRNFVKKFQKNKRCALIWNGEKCDLKWYSVIQNGRRWPFWEILKKSSVLIWNSEKCDWKSFPASKMTAGGNFVDKISEKWKLRIDLKWREMRSKVIFGHPKWPWRPFCDKISKKIKVAYWSEMARNAIKSDFRSSKMAAGGHFVNFCSEKWNLCIDLKWWEMRSKSDFWRK